MDSLESNCVPICRIRSPLSLVPLAASAQAWRTWSNRCCCVSGGDGVGALFPSADSLGGVPEGGGVPVAPAPVQRLRTPANSPALFERSTFPDLRAFAHTPVNTVISHVGPQSYPSSVGLTTWPGASQVGFECQSSGEPGASFQVGPTSTQRPPRPHLPHFTLNQGIGVPGG